MGRLYPKALVFFFFLKFDVHNTYITAVIVADDIVISRVTL